MHVSYYFPDWMIAKLQGGEKIGIITEADLCSWFDDGIGQCYNRNSLLDKDDDTASTASSLRAFFANESLATYVVAWLLNNNAINREQDWHEAYRDDGAERSWFRPWWSADE